MNTKKLMKTCAIGFAALVVAACLIRAFAVPAAQSGMEQAQAAQIGLEEKLARQAGLSDAERRAVSEYPSDVAVVAGILEGNSWTQAGSSGSSVEFGPGYAVLTNGDDTHVAKAVIRAVGSKGTAPDIGTYWLSIALDEGDVVAELSRAAGADDGTWTLSCPKLFGGKALVQAGVASNIEVGDLDKSLVELIGGQEKAAELKEAVAQAISRKAPKAKSVKWDGKAEIDFDSRTVKFGYEVETDARARASVSATFGGDDIKVS